MPYYSSDCFSGECGLCFQCNHNYNDIKKYRFPQDNNLKLSRTYDMKLFSEMHIQDIINDYNQKLKNIPYNLVSKKNNNKKYHLKYSKDICDNINCQCIYMNSNQTMKNYYEKLPIYKREDDLCKLCIVCIDDDE